MTGSHLPDIYHSYIECLNRQDWASRGRFVQDHLRYNDRPIGLAGYRDLLMVNVAQIPDLRFDVSLLIADAHHVAARLWFDFTPQGTFLGLPVNGRTLTFTENVIYRFRGDRIEAVWTVIDKAAIDAQI